MAEWDWILGVFLDLNTNFKRFNAGSNGGEFVVGSTYNNQEKRKRRQLQHERYMKSKARQIKRLRDSPKPPDLKLLAMENAARLARAGHLPGVAGLQTQVETPFFIPCADFVDNGNTATGALASPLAQAPLHVVGGEISRRLVAGQLAGDAREEAGCALRAHKNEEVRESKNDERDGRDMRVYARVCCRCGERETAGDERDGQAILYYAPTASMRRVSDTDHTDATRLRPRGRGQLTEAADRNPRRETAAVFRALVRRQLIMFGALCIASTRLVVVEFIVITTII
ncbi:hypothetical protein R3P38DRAFT_2805663 [Favolaschia claudopus]|uniref:Nuclear transcription factor Y subunit n=1 Tax=Favolaschia claudopus TaxID=2862362 RepID=A0AAV9ZM03_9AGAR